MEGIYLFLFVYKVMSPTLSYSSVTSHFNMETLKEDDESFDSKFQNGQLLKTVIYRQCDDNDWTWVMEGPGRHRRVLQSPPKDRHGDDERLQASCRICTDFSKFKDKDIKKVETSLKDGQGQFLLTYVFIIKGK